MQNIPAFLNSSIFIDNGETAKIQDITNKTGYTMFFFARSSTCPVCIIHIKKIESSLSIFQSKNIIPIIVIPDGVDQAKKLKNKLKSELMFIADEQNDVQSNLEIQKKIFGLAQESGTLLIDSKNTVKYFKKSVIPIGSYNQTEVFQNL